MHQRRGIRNTSSGWCNTFTIYPLCTCLMCVYRVKKYWCRARFSHSTLSWSDRKQPSKEQLHIPTHIHTRTYFYMYAQGVIRYRKITYKPCHNLSISYLIVYVIFYNQCCNLIIYNILMIIYVRIQKYIGEIQRQAL